MTYTVGLTHGLNQPLYFTDSERTGESVVAIYLATEKNLEQLKRNYRKLRVKGESVYVQGCVKSLDKNRAQARVAVPHTTAGQSKFTIEIQFLNEALLSKITQSQTYFFKLAGKKFLSLPDLNFFGLLTVKFYCAEVLPNLPDIDVLSFDEFLAKQRSTWALKLAGATAFLALSIWAYQHLLTGSLSLTELRQERIQQIKNLQNVENLKSSLETKNLKLLAKKFKQAVEARTDVGILINSAWVNPKNEQDILFIYVHPKWKDIPFNDRLLGLKKICSLWSKISSQHSSKSSVILLEEKSIRKISQTRSTGKTTYDLKVGECGEKLWVSE